MGAKGVQSQYSWSNLNITGNEMHHAPVKLHCGQYKTRTADCGPWTADWV